MDLRRPLTVTQREGLRAIGELKQIAAEREMSFLRACLAELGESENQARWVFERESNEFVRVPDDAPQALEPIGP